MVSGIFDTLSHIMEIYLSPEDEDNISDDFAEALMRSILRNTPVAIANPRDYVARSNLMWASSLALSGILAPSKQEDWEVHQIQHQIAAYYPSAHGMGLAAVSPAYYRLVCPHGLPRFRRFAVNVWGVDPAGKSDREVALAGIDAMAAFIRDSRMTPQPPGPGDPRREPSGGDRRHLQPPPGRVLHPHPGGRASGAPGELLRH